MRQASYAKRLPRAGLDARQASYVERLPHAGLDARQASDGERARGRRRGPTDTSLKAVTKVSLVDKQGDQVQSLIDARNIAQRLRYPLPQETVTLPHARARATHRVRNK